MEDEEEEEEEEPNMLTALIPLSLSRVVGSERGIVCNVPTNSGLGFGKMRRIAT